MNIQDIFSPYAIVAMEAAKQLQIIEMQLKVETNKRNKAILKEQKNGIKHIIDRCFRKTCEYIPVSSSQGALDYCEEEKLGDIFQIRWNGQKKFERQKIRKDCKLIQEHKTTVSSLSNKLKEVTSLDKAIEVFESQEIVWILKEENDRLPKSNRPDHDKAYKDENIEIIKSPNSYGHLFK